MGTPATAPGPSGPQMLGHFLRIRANPLQYLMDMRRDYGTVVQFPIPRPPTYLIADAQAARHVLMASPRRYSKQTIQYSALSLVTGEGLLTSDGDVWRRQRRLVQPAFSGQATMRIGPHVTTALQRLEQRWQRLPATGEIIDLDEVMMASTLEIVGAALFGTDLTAAADQLAQATLRALEVVVARARVPITPPRWLPTPANRRLRAAVAELDEVVVTMIQQRKAGSTESAHAETPDMLDLLLAGDAQGDQLSLRELRDQVVTFIVAGHETVASALAWTLWCVSGDEAVQDALHAEAVSVLGDGDADVSMLHDLPYACAVYDEAMRLYPPAWLISRRSLEDDVLAGREIPAGSLVITSPYLVHRDPIVWDEPDVFKPERFLGLDTRSATVATSYWPFGGGPRLCIGRDFAYAEGVLLLAGLARQVRLSRDPKQPAPQAVPQVTIRTGGGVPLRVTRRG